MKPINSLNIARNILKCLEVKILRHLYSTWVNFDVIIIISNARIWSICWLYDTHFRLKVSYFVSINFGVEILTIANFSIDLYLQKIKVYPKNRYLIRIGIQKIKVYLKNKSGYRYDLSRSVDGSDTNQIVIKLYMFPFLFFKYRYGSNIRQILLNNC